MQIDCNWSAALTWFKDLTAFTARSWYGFLFTEVHGIKLLFFLLTSLKASIRRLPYYTFSPWKRFGNISVRFFVWYVLPIQTHKIKTRGKNWLEHFTDTCIYFQNNILVLIKNVIWWKKHVPKLIKANILYLTDPDNFGNKNRRPLKNNKKLRFTRGRWRACWMSLDIANVCFWIIWRWC